jgi:hypothetical protein
MKYREPFCVPLDIDRQGPPERLAADKQGQFILGLKIRAAAGYARYFVLIPLIKRASCQMADTSCVKVNCIH